MVAEVTNGQSNSFTTTFQESSIEEEPMKCMVENHMGNDFHQMPTKNILKENLNAFSKCVEIKITDKSDAGLNFEEVSDNCELKRVSSNVAIMKPVGSCFFNVQEDSKFNVEVVPVKNCGNRKYLVENKINPSQIMGEVGTYMYPENYLGNRFHPTKSFPPRSIILDLNPGRELLSINKRKTSDGHIFPQPSEYVIPDINFKKVTIRKFNSGKVGFKLDFLVNTFMNEKCVDGLCSSVGNYDVPVTPKMVVYRLKNNGKKKAVVSSYIGGRVQNNWQGILKTKAITKNINFNVDDLFRIELIFSDPSYDYSGLKKLYETKIDTSSSFVFGGGRVGEAVLKPLTGLGGIGVIRSLPSLGRFSKEGLPEYLHDSFDFLENSLSFDFFPPKYSKVCNKSFSNCRRSNKKKHLVLGMNFKVLDTKRGNIKIGELGFDRISPLGDEYQLQNVKKLPKINCN